jgi:hypothetical protein
MADSDNGRLSATELARAALTTVEELTGYRSEAVTGLEWDGDSWRVTVDALEMARVPDSMDVLGAYEVRLDDQGTLRGYRRVKRFKRCEVRQEEE